MDKALYSVQLNCYLHVAFLLVHIVCNEIGMKCVGEDHGVCQCLWGLRRARLFLFVHILASSVLQSSRSTNLSQSPAELKLQNEFGFSKRDFFFFGFFKDSWQGPNYSRFFNWKTGISKALREKWRFLSTPSWRRVSLHKRPPPATSPPTLQVLKHLALLKRKRQHYHHQRFQAR